MVATNELIEERYDKQLHFCIVSALGERVNNWTGISLAVFVLRFLDAELLLKTVHVGPALQSTTACVKDFFNNNFHFLGFSRCDLRNYFSPDVKKIF